MIALRRNRIAGLLVAAGAYIVDQALKQYIVGPLDLAARGQLDLLPFFRFTWVKNNGVSLGLLGGDGPLWQWGLVALTGLIAVGVAVWLWRERNRSDAIALGLVLGGALGNITDRARVGHVIDFLDLHFGDFRPFLIFNPADVAISIGVLLLVLRAFLTRDPKRPETVNA